MQNTIVQIYYIVHGFLNAIYDVVEDERLDTVFQLNVKGETAFSDALVVSGIIITVEGDTASKCH